MQCCTDPMWSQQRLPSITASLRFGRQVSAALRQPQRGEAAADASGGGGSAAANAAVASPAPSAVGPSGPSEPPAGKRPSGGGEPAALTAAASPASSVSGATATPGPSGGLSPLGAPGTLGHPRASGPTGSAAPLAWKLPAMDGPGVLLVDAAGECNHLGSPDAMPGGAQGLPGNAQGQSGDVQRGPEGGAGPEPCGDGMAASGGVRGMMRSLVRSVKRTGSALRRREDLASPFADTPEPAEAPELSAAARRSAHASAALAPPRAPSATSARTGSSEARSPAATAGAPMPAGLPSGKPMLRSAPATAGQAPAAAAGDAALAAQRASLQEATLNTAATADSAHGRSAEFANPNLNLKPGHVAAKEGATLPKEELPVVARGVIEQRLTGLLRVPFMRIELEDGRLAVIEEFGCVLPVRSRPS